MLVLALVNMVLSRTALTSVFDVLLRWCSPLPPSPPVVLWRNAAPGVLCASGGHAKCAQPGERLHGRQVLQLEPGHALGTTGGSGLRERGLRGRQNSCCSELHASVSECVSEGGSEVLTLMTAAVMHSETSFRYNETGYNELMDVTKQSQFPMKSPWMAMYLTRSFNEAKTSSQWV